MVLVGNKSDLDDCRQVSNEMVQQTKMELMNNCPYIETSAKYNMNVAKLFLELLQQAKSLDLPGTPDLAAGRRMAKRLSRRLSSFSSLPNITLIHRKSSGGSNKLEKNLGHGITTITAADMGLENGDMKIDDQKCTIL